MECSVGYRWGGVWGRGHCPPHRWPVHGATAIHRPQAPCHRYIKLYVLADNTGVYVVDVYLYTGRRGRVRRFGSCSEAPPGALVATHPTWERVRGR